MVIESLSTEFPEVCFPSRHALTPEQGPGTLLGWPSRATGASGTNGVVENVVVIVIVGGLEGPPHACSRTVRMVGPVSRERVGEIREGIGRGRDSGYLGVVLLVAIAETRKDRVSGTVRELNGEVPWGGEVEQKWID